MKKLKELERYLKESLILNSFSFEDKDPILTSLKPGLALRLLSKGLFYIRAIVQWKESRCPSLQFIFFFLDKWWKRVLSSLRWL